MDVHPAIDPNCGAGCEGKFTRSHCRDGAPDIFRAFGEIIFDEGEARARGSIGSHAFGDRRIDRSVANDNVEVSPGQCDHNALADPTHSARDSRDLMRRSRVRHNNCTGMRSAAANKHGRAEALPGAMLPSPISLVISLPWRLFEPAPYGLELVLPTGKLSETLRTARYFLSRAIRVHQIGSAAGHLGKAVMAPTLDVECDRKN
jgi:hypothetical protein